MNFDLGQGAQTVFYMMLFNVVATGLLSGVNWLRANLSDPKSTAGVLVKGFFLTALSGTLQAITANTQSVVRPNNSLPLDASAPGKVVLPDPSLPSQGSQKP